MSAQLGIAGEIVGAADRRVTQRSAVQRVAGISRRSGKWPAFEPEIDRLITDASPRGLIRHSSLPAATVMSPWGHEFDQEPKAHRLGVEDCRKKYIRMMALHPRRW